MDTADKPRYVEEYTAGGRGIRYVGDGVRGNVLEPCVSHLGINPDIPSLSSTPCARNNFPSLRSAPCARNPALTSISDPANAIHNLAAGIRAAFMVKSRFYLHVSAAILLSGLWHFTFSRLALTEYGLIDAQFRIILCNSLAKGTYDTPDFTRHR